MKRMDIQQIEELDRSKIKIDNFIIQHTDGRNETTLWVRGVGWMTMSKIEEQLNNIDATVRVLCENEQKYTRHTVDGKGVGLCLSCNRVREVKKDG